MQVRRYFIVIYFLKDHQFSLFILLIMPHMFIDQVYFEAVDGMGAQTGLCEIDRTENFISMFADAFSDFSGGIYIHL